MERSAIIKQLLSENDNIRKITEWFSSQEKMEGARCGYDKEELTEKLTSLPKEQFDAMLMELDIKLQNDKIPPLAAGQQHQQSSRGDDLSEPLQGSLLDSNPQDIKSGAAKYSKCFEWETKKQQLEKEHRQLKLQVQEAEKKIQNLKIEHQEENNELRKEMNNLKRQVSALGMQMEKLKLEKAQSENALNNLREVHEDHLRIIHYFHQELGERSKTIEELIDKVHILENTNSENNNSELIEKANQLEEKLHQFYIETKHNSELFERAKMKIEELEAENERLKDEFLMQQASQAASHLSRETEIAHSVNQMVQEMHRVYQQLREFARKLGHQRSSPRNENQDDE